MSNAVFDPPNLNLANRSLLGRLWYWMVHDPRPPVQRHELKIERQAPARLIYAPTRMLLNALLIGVMIPVLTVMFLASNVMINVANKHPELGVVAERYISDRIDDWLMTHNYPCVFWELHDEEGHAIPQFGGPRCDDFFPRELLNPSPETEGGHTL